MTAGYSQPFSSRFRKQTADLVDHLASAGPYRIRNERLSVFITVTLIISALNTYVQSPAISPAFKN
jgi:hypothetical protein